jgi:hypothetical protein
MQNKRMFYCGSFNWIVNKRNSFDIPKINGKCFISSKHSANLQRPYFRMQ